MEEEVIQLTVFQALSDILFDLNLSVFIGGLVVVCLLFLLFKRNKNIPKISVTIGSLLLFYYVYLTFYNIVGIPSVGEMNRLAGFGESVVNPNIYLIPFGEGIELSFILNIVLFVPIGFLVSVISPSLRKWNRVAMLTLQMSLIIEISQIFTLARATDINDLIANTLGGIVGYLSYVLLSRMKWLKLPKGLAIEEDATKYLPFVVYLIAFMSVFLT